LILRCLMRPVASPHRAKDPMFDDRAYQRTTPNRAPRQHWRTKLYLWDGCVAGGAGVGTPHCQRKGHRFYTLCPWSRPSRTL